MQLARFNDLRWLKDEPLFRVALRTAPKEKLWEAWAGGGQTPGVPGLWEDRFGDTHLLFDFGQSTQDVSGRLCFG